MLVEYLPMETEYLANGMVTVCEGESGAWVVHSASPAFYGHVVATNIFGDAYVIPAVDTLENIRKCLGAVSVQLPTNNTGFKRKEESIKLPTREQLWSDCFSKDRGVTGRFFEAQSNFNNDPFLEEIDHYAAFSVNEVKRFCEGASIEDFGLDDKQKSAWLDDRSVSGNLREYHSRLNAGQLYTYLKEQVCILAVKHYYECTKANIIRPSGLE